MKRSTMLAAVVAAIATASLVGAFRLGDRPETSSETRTELAVHDVLPVTDGDQRADTGVSITRSILGSSSYVRADDVSNSGTSVYRSLRPEHLTPVQQATGTLCETSSGSCIVPPQPIGSPCRCGEGDTAMIGEITR